MNQEAWQALRAKGPSVASLEDFRVYVGEFREAFPEWRPGQAWFNALCYARPGLAEQISDTALDPFHADRSIRPLDAWLHLHWEARDESANQ